MVHLILFWVTPDGHTRSDKKRKADRSITMKSDHISSVYNCQEDGDYWFAFGDVGLDALLFIHHVEEANTVIQAGSVIEVFVARGKSNECNTLCNLYSDGELDEDMEALRQQARPTAEQGK